MKCTLDRLEVRESTYSLRARSNQGHKTTTKPWGTQSRETWDHDSDGAAREVGISRSTDDPLLPSVSMFPGSQQRSSPIPNDQSPESLILATSPPSHFAAAGEISVVPGTVQNPVITVDWSPPTSDTILYRKQGSNYQRVVADCTEQYVFEFYINYAGPWVSALQL